MGLKVRRGIAQDATFTEADPGSSESKKPRGNEAKARRSRDGTWAKKAMKLISDISCIKQLISITPYVI